MKEDDLFKVPKKMEEDIDEALEDGVIHPGRISKPRINDKYE